jgi:hypothetical protein
MTDLTSPDVMAGNANFETLAIRGVGFAPEKKEWLVLPAGVDLESIDDFLTNQRVKVLGKSAIERLQL